jgi:hypothetical protein
VLRGSRGEVAGAKSGASSAERSMSEHGNRSWSALVLRIRRGGGAGPTVGRSVRGGAEPS